MVGVCCKRRAPTPCLIVAEDAWSSRMCGGGLSPGVVHLLSVAKHWCLHGLAVCVCGNGLSSGIVHVLYAVEDVCMV